MKTLNIVFIICFGLLHAKAFAGCATDINSLRDLFNDPGFSTRWVETTASDGNPLVVSITPRNGGLFLQFVKTNEGLWASGTANICGQNGQATASISADQISLGSAAPFVMRMAMGHGATFSLRLLSSDQLQISTTGWGSTFAPQ